MQCLVGFAKQAPVPTKEPGASLRLINEADHQAEPQGREVFILKPKLESNLEPYSLQFSSKVL